MSSARRPASARRIADSLRYRSGTVLRPLLVLHPRRWPPAVFVARGRSHWPADVPVRIVTTFNRALFDASGRECIQSHRQHNPDYEVHAYVEADSPTDLGAMVEELGRMGAVAHRIDQDARLVRLEQSLSSYVPQEYGGSADESLFAPVPGDERGYWRRNMIRWMRKVVAMNAAAEGFTGLLIWADSDAYAKAPLTRGVLARTLRGTGVVYWKAGRPFTETGLLVFDLTRPGMHAFVAEMLRFYEDKLFLAGSNWSDCIAFDSARTAPGAPPARDIAVYADGGGHVVAYSPLSHYLAHGKGRHRRSGLYAAAGLD